MNISKETLDLALTLIRQVSNIPALLQTPDGIVPNPDYAGHGAAIQSAFAELTAARASLESA